MNPPDPGPLPRVPPAHSEADLAIAEDNLARAIEALDSGDLLAFEAVIDELIEPRSQAIYFVMDNDPEQFP